MATADNSNILNQPGFSYKQLLWGDLIDGTKNQLQSIGLAVDMAFPGEQGGPKRELKVTDPRGFPTRICRDGENGYSAYIHFPGRDFDYRDAWIDCGGDVQKRAGAWADSYMGTAQALATAGLVRLDQLPGQPGMRKVRVTILADGTLPKGAATAKCYEAQDAGAKRIEKASKNTFIVHVLISSEESDRRAKLEKDVRREWESRMQALPRPAPLVAAIHIDEMACEKATPEGFRLDLLRTTDAFFGVAWAAIAEQKDGVSLDDATLDIIHGHLSAIRSEIEHADVRLRRNVQLRVIQGGKMA